MDPVKEEFFMAVKAEPVEIPVSTVVFVHTKIFGYVVDTINDLATNEFYTKIYTKGGDDVLDLSKYEVYARDAKHALHTHIEGIRYVFNKLGKIDLQQMGKYG